MSALSDRDANAQLASNNVESGEKKMAAAGAENKAQRTLEQRIADANNKQSSGTYISPSDAILSPASQKLQGFKQRQINKQNNKNPTARSLFSRTASSISAASLDDAEDVSPK